jgi:hypothetical protein
VWRRLAQLLLVVLSAIALGAGAIVGALVDVRATALLLGGIGLTLIAAIVHSSAALFPPSRRRDDTTPLHGD